MKKLKIGATKPHNSLTNNELKLILHHKAISPNDSEILLKRVFYGFVIVEVLPRKIRLFSMNGEHLIEYLINHDLMLLLLILYYAIAGLFQEDYLQLICNDAVFLAIWTIYVYGDAERKLLMENNTDIGK